MFVQCPFGEYYAIRYNATPLLYPLHTQAFQELYYQADKVHGQSGYGVTKLDGIVDRIIRYQFSKLSSSSGSEIIESQNRKAIELARARHNMLSLQLAAKERDLADYQSEVIRVIRGESRMDAELLNNLVKKTEAEIQELKVTVNQAKQELDRRLTDVAEEQQEYSKLKTWADLYDNCSFAAKKMIAIQFIKSVYVYRDYRLEIEFNVSFEDFKSMITLCEDQGQGKEPVIYISDE